MAAPSLQKPKPLRLHSAMKFKPAFYCFLALSAFAAMTRADAQGSFEPEIKIHLHAEQPLAPLYLAKMQVKAAPNKVSQVARPNYANQLESILYFDFQYNGKTKILPTQDLKEKILSKEKQEAFDPKSWKELGVRYVVQTFLADDKLSATVFCSQTGSIKYFPAVTLSGDLTKDRRIVHKMADSIHKALFEEDGIAASTILYSLQPKSAPDTSDFQAEIWECDWDGANAKQLTHDGSYNITPCILPNPSGSAMDKFMYVSYKYGQAKIFFANFKDAMSKSSISLRGNQLLPAVSPSLDKIAFVSDAAGKVDLFLQHFSPEKGMVDKPIQLYSYPNSVQASPTFSPDGTKLAFVSDQDGSPQIYIIPTKTIKGKRAQAIRVSHANPESSCPTWSPDGSKLAYSARTGEHRQIWIFDFETRQEKQLTFGPGNKENPCWAPNSCHIVFNASEQAGSEIYMVNINQIDPVRISKGSGKKFYPSWGKLKQR